MKGFMKMKIDLGRKFTEFSGNVIKDEQGNEFDLRMAIFRSLVNTYQDEQGLSGEDKFKRGELASQVMGCKENFIILKAEDVVTIKNLIAKLYGTYVVWQAWKMLEE
jgi:hypothetical protein